VPALTQQAVIIVRHGEQTQTGGGMMDGDPPLNETGQRRAAALAENLRDAGVTVIITSQYARARQTAEPLAAALRVEPLIVRKDDAAGLTDALKRQGGATVLVVGHSDTIPSILTALGHGGAIEFPKTEFNNAWLVVPRAEGKPVVTRVRF
jgi:broad specificity phosphatase PhoE